MYYVARELDEARVSFVYRWSIGGRQLNNITDQADGL